MKELLKCGDPQCGCRITFESREKPLASGEIGQYDLYHCSNSKKAHGSLKGMYSEESELWEQFGKAIPHFDLPPDLAQYIADTLNENDAKLRNRASKGIEDCRMAFVSLKEQENNAFDALTLKTIDKETYARQIDRIKSQQNQTEQNIIDLQKSVDSIKLITAQDVLMLARDMPMLWKGAPEQERVAFLKKLIEQATLNGTSVSYSLRNAFERVPYSLVK